MNIWTPFTKNDKSNGSGQFRHRIKEQAETNVMDERAILNLQRKTLMYRWRECDEILVYSR